MPQRHVLILRLYPPCERGDAEGLFICEDPESGLHCTFRDGAELWRLVETKLARCGRSQATPRDPESGSSNTFTAKKENT